MKNLKLKTVKELREMAKELNIVGRWNMNKLQIIEAISFALENRREEEEKMKSNNLNSVEITSDIPKDTKRKRTSQDYLANKETGLIVAIELNEKYFSGIVEEYLPNGKVKVITKHNTVFIVEPEKVKWVKTGSRWPKFIFEVFKKENHSIEQA